MLYFVLFFIMNFEFSDMLCKDLRISSIFHTTAHNITEALYCACPLIHRAGYSDTVCSSCRYIIFFLNSRLTCGINRSRLIAPRFDRRIRASRFPFQYQSISDSIRSAWQNIYTHFTLRTVTGKRQCSINLFYHNIKRTYFCLITTHLPAISRVRLRR